MKKNRVMVLAATVFMTFLGIAQVHALSISFALSDADITAGEAFSVGIMATDAYIDFDEVLAFGFDVYNSDSSILRYESTSVNTPVFEDLSGVYPDTAVAGIAFPGLTDDSILIATLNFTALSAGNVTFGIQSDLSDPNEGLVYLWEAAQDITSNYSLTVGEANTAAPVPEPATLLLLGSGLTGAAVVKRRKRR